MVKKLFLVLCAAVFLSCGPDKQVPTNTRDAVTLYYDGVSGVTRIEDLENNIICYTNYGHGISCLYKPAKVQP